MTVTSTLCSLTHRGRWQFVARKITGPSLFTRQRHVGVYRCDACGREHRIVGDKLRPSDASLALDARPPAESIAMRMHRMLGGPV